MFSPILILAFPLAFFGSSPSFEDASSWPDFRGPRGDGLVENAGIPIQWSEDEHVTWKTEIHGQGWSSPVVNEELIWLTTSEDEGRERYALAIDSETGDVLHDILLLEMEDGGALHPLNSHASPSPVLESERAYINFGTFGTFCLETETGDVLWERRDIHCAHSVGPGSSPYLYEDLLIFHMDGTDVQYVIALDKETGETRWKADRNTEFATPSVDESHKAYGTPFIVNVEGEDQLVCLGPDATVAYVPETGEEIWRVRYQGYSMATRPVRLGDRLYICSGFPTPKLIAIRLGGKGDITDSHIEWTVRRSVPTMPSPVIANDLLFMVNDAGIASCVSPETGKTIWKERLGGEFSSSVLAADGRVFFFDRAGKTTVVEAADEYKLVGENHLEDGFMASPAVVDSTLYLRTKTHLYRLDS